jgi:hypothetical protein
MNTPGVTAEVSVYRTRNHCNMVGTFDQSGRVIPALYPSGTGGPDPRGICFDNCFARLRPDAAP